MSTVIPAFAGMTDKFVMYFNWDEITIEDFSDTNLGTLYDQGYLFTRLGRGVMHQTRSLRVDLAKFHPSSENRRVLKKTEYLTIEQRTLPYADYDWKIGKTGKDFYETKFGPGTFSANKIKELITDAAKSSFNALLCYRAGAERIAGYCIARETADLLHYGYPFYALDADLPNLGLGMMLKAILLAQELGKKYVYLGSFQRSTDTYKLQFSGLEWFDGKQWRTNVTELKIDSGSPIGVGDKFRGNDNERGNGHV